MENFGKNDQMDKIIDDRIIELIEKALLIDMIAFMTNNYFSTNCKETIYQIGQFANTRFKKEEKKE